MPLLHLIAEGDKVPDASYKRALCLLEQNRTADGILEERLELVRFVPLLRGTVQ